MGSAPPEMRMISAWRRVVMHACVLSLVGCAAADGPDLVDAEVDIVDRTVEGISSANVNYISGTYAGCAQRSGSWSLSITGSPTLPFAPLSVVKGDTACVLSLTTIHTAIDGALTVNTNVTPGAGLVLGGAYGSAKAFGNPLRFYANAMLSAVGASGPFTIRLLLSSDPNPLTYTNTAGYAAVSSSGAAADVAAPDYAIDTNATTLAVGVDALKKVVSVTGSLVLSTGVQTGEWYLIYDGTIADAYVAIDAVWINPAQVASRVAMATTILGTALLSVGESLPKSRSLVIAHTASGVTSYEKFAITFAAPP